MALSFALALLATPLAQATPPDTVPIAMTRGGVRLEVSEKPKPGALDVKTAFGVLYTPRDSVAIVMNSPRRDTWRKELEADPKLSLAPTIARFRAEGRIAELLEMMPVLEARLHENELSREAEARRDELLDATRAIAYWGEALDPLPGSLSRTERLEELWRRAKKAKGHGAMLPGSRLLGEITAGGAGFGDHQLPIDGAAALRSRACAGPSPSPPSFLPPATPREAGTGWTCSRCSRMAWSRGPSSAGRPTSVWKKAC